MKKRWSFQTQESNTFYSVTYDDIWLIFSFLSYSGVRSLTKFSHWALVESPGPFPTGSLVFKLDSLSGSMCMRPCSGKALIIPICQNLHLCLYFDSFPYELRTLSEAWSPLSWVSPGVPEAPITDAHPSKTPFLLAGPPWVWVLDRFSGCHAPLSILPAFTTELVS